MIHMHPCHVPFSVMPSTMVHFIDLDVAVLELEEDRYDRPIMLDLLTGETWRAKRDVFGNYRKIFTNSENIYHRKMG